MTLTDFLVARSLEALAACGCDYHVAGDQVICLCETPSDAVEQALNDFELIHWCARALGPDNSIAAILADAYVGHPDYDSKWHFRTGSG